MKRFLPQVIPVVLILSFVLLLTEFLSPGFMPLSIPPSARNLLWIILAVSAILLAVSYLHELPRRAHSMAGENDDDRVTAQGSVIGFGNNPAGDIDKIALGLNGDTTWFHFPPHTAKKITDLAVLQSIVAVEYHSQPRHNGERVNEIISLRSVKTGESVSTEGIPPPPPHPGETVTISGNRADLAFSPDNQARFFVLSGNRVVLPPHSAQTFLPLLRQGSRFAVTGNIRSGPDGLVSQGGLPMIQAKAIKIDSITYLVE